MVLSGFYGLVSSLVGICILHSLIKVFDLRPVSVELASIASLERDL